MDILYSDSQALSHIHHDHGVEASMERYYEHQFFMISLLTTVRTQNPKVPIQRFFSKKNGCPSGFQ